VTIPPEELTPIPVRIVDRSDLAASARKVHRDVTYRTIVLSALNPVRPVFAQDLSRMLVIVQAFGNDVVLCETQSKAEDPANSVAGLPNPEGYLLAKANAGPTYLPATDLSWATAASFPAMITICLINKVPG
jgi:hypothetical protein